MGSTITGQTDHLLWDTLTEVIMLRLFQKVRINSPSSTYHLKYGFIAKIFDDGGPLVKVTGEGELSYSASEVEVQQSYVDINLPDPMARQYIIISYDGASGATMGGMATLGEIQEHHEEITERNQGILELDGTETLAIPVDANGKKWEWCGDADEDPDGDGPFTSDN